MAEAAAEESSDLSSRILSVSNAYYKLIIESLQPTCQTLRPDGNEHLLFATAATILHRYLRFRESLHDVDSLSAICTGLDGFKTAQSSSSSSAIKSIDISPSQKQLVYRVVIMVSSLIFLSGKILEEVLSIKQCVEESLARWGLTRSQIDDATMESLHKGVVQREHQLLRYIGFETASLASPVESQIRRIARRESLPRSVRRAAYRILDECYLTRRCLDSDSAVLAIACLYTADLTMSDRKHQDDRGDGSLKEPAVKRHKTDSVNGSRHSDCDGGGSASQWWLSSRYADAVDEHELECLRSQLKLHR